MSPRRAATGLAALLLAVLAGCGFQPLHGNNGNNGPTSALHGIVVHPIPDRAGVRLRSELERMFSPAAPAVTHTLAIALAVQSQVTAIDPDASERRRNLTLVADVRLIPAGGKPDAPEFTTRVRANAGTEQLPSDFSTLVSEQAAEQRAVEQLAYQIRQQLALHFARQG